MASTTIRNLDDGAKRRLNIRTAEHGRSMEDEAHDILRQALAETAPTRHNLADAIRRRFVGLGGVDLPEIPREPLREPLRLNERSSSIPTFSRN